MALDRLVGSYLADRFPRGIGDLSSVSVGQLLAEPVARALTMAAQHAFHVRTTVSEAAWNGAQELRQP